MVPGLSTRDLQAVELRRRVWLRAAATAHRLAELPLTPRSLPLAAWARSVLAVLPRGRARPLPAGRIERLPA